ncbi:hypothetical protein GJAV_G00226670 [Gymnothorax javanicus]|nr:hypothetical protein GJAV_G00226670 [Gymnothorax javanicus]
MDMSVNLRVNFRGNGKSFQVSESETSWESMEAMIKRSFGLSNLQLTYFDEDNEEVSINSQEEYEEALKSAQKQGGRLHMSAFETKGPTGRGLAKPRGGEPKSEARPGPHCPTLTKTVSQRIQMATHEQALGVIKEMKGTKEEDKTPPAWFTSYMEKFKEQVVKEAVEKICREFSGQCCIHKPSGADAQGSEVPNQLLPGRPQLKAEVKEIPQDGEQWNWSNLLSPKTCCPEPAAQRKSCCSLPNLLQWKSKSTQTCCSESPHRPCPPVGPVMTALFLDENLPDGSRLQPGTKFVKYWKMRNTGSLAWDTETKLRFMWGNLTLASSEKQKEVGVPFLQPEQVGVVSVAFTAPMAEGTYTSHWRLAHRGEQFGPRVWCSIVVDPQAPPISTDRQPLSPPTTPQVAQLKEGPRQDKEVGCRPALRDCALMSVGLDCERDYYIPSVDLLTAQDLLSFELLDINIVQELEHVPKNTPADMTPCISPLPRHPPLLGQIREEAEPLMAKSLPAGRRGLQKNHSSVPAQEEGEDDISGTQFVCETVIRSLALVEEPERVPLRRPRPHPTPLKAAAACDSSPSSAKPAENRAGLRTIEAPPPVTSQVIQEVRSPAVARKESDIASVSTEPSEVGAGLAGEGAGLAGGGVGLAGKGVGLVGEGVDPAVKGAGLAGDGAGLAGEGAGSVGGGVGLAGEGVGPSKVTSSTADERDKVRSRASSASSDDYIIILPDCFDTSRPLGESMYSSVLSQPGPEEGAPCGRNSVSDMLCASQTLDTVPLTPVVLPTPTPRPERLGNKDLTAEGLDTSELYQPAATPQRTGPDQSQPASPSKKSDTETPPGQKPPGGLTDGLVKGAFSVAASAYKALFTGQPGASQPPTDAASQDALMAVLLEMGFGDRPLNQRLLQKHSYNLLDVVNELVQRSDNDWFTTRY